MSFQLVSRGIAIVGEIALIVVLQNSELNTTERYTIAQHIWNTNVHLPNCLEIIPNR